MPGAWELEPPGCLVAVVTSREIVPTRWAFAIKELALPNQSTCATFAGMPWDQARNMAAAAALEKGFTWLFFLDDDVIVPPDALQRLIGRGKDIVSGLYYRRLEPIMPVAMYKKPDKTNEFVTDFRPGEILEVDMVGAGALLIHRRVLERMEKPWFQWTIGREDIPPHDRCSEDFYFCAKAKKAGFEIWLDSSVQCQHAGYGKSELGGRFSPL